MGYMFNNCINLTTVPNFNTSKVTDVSFMFNGCLNLTTVPNFNLASVKQAACMFNNCINLTTVPNFNLRGANSITNIFLNCNNLTDASYHNIAFALPTTATISASTTNTDIRITGLDPNRFTISDKYNLIEKGYTGIEIPDAQKYIISYE